MDFQEQLNIIKYNILLGKFLKTSQEDPQINWIVDLSGLCETSRSEAKQLKL
jgi:hypothetical protein